MASGGAEHQMLILAELLNKKGYDVTLVTCFDYPDHYTPSPDLKVVKLKIYGSKIRRQLQISKFLWQQKADCIISFRVQMNFMVLLPMIFKPKVKIICGERNLTIGKPGFYGGMCLHYLYPRANYIVTNSHAQEAFIRNYTKRYNKKLLTITNYTQLDKYPFSYHNEDGKLAIGVFCRYDKQKNYERFAEAVSIASKQKPDSFEVHWYGNIKSEEGCKRQDFLLFQSLIEKYDITDVIHLHDAVKNVPEILSKCDAICQPSLFEGFSNSLSEGICCGKVGIAGDVSDNKLMVIDGVNGFLFNPNDPQDIAEKLIKYVEMSKEDRFEMCKKSRENAERLFNQDSFVNSYINLVEN